MSRSTGLARFPRSRLASLSFVKISMCSDEPPGWPEISVTGMKIFPYEHSSPGDRDETFLTK